MSSIFGDSSALLRRAVISASIVIAIVTLWVPNISAHAGVSVTPVYSQSPPVFDATGQPAGGCNLSIPSGYRDGAKVSIDSGVTVFVEYTNTDIFFCFVGIQPRNLGQSQPDPNTLASIFFDLEHEGSTAPVGDRYLFEIRPHGASGALGTSGSGAGYAVPLPLIKTLPPVPQATWNYNGADVPTAEFLVSWSAEIRISKALLVGFTSCPSILNPVGSCGTNKWRTLGMRLAYTDGLSGRSASWPQYSSAADPGGWGDLIFPDSPNTRSSGVVTNLNGNARLGAYFDTVLTPQRLKLSSFGKLKTWEVTGQIYAQPLYVRGLTLPDGSAHRVVFVATEENFVYAFDVDSYKELWSVHLGIPMQARKFGCNNLTPWVGVTSTPVIDLNQQTIYIVARTASLGHGVYSLHALDLATGQERKQSPVKISGSVMGTGISSKNGIIDFDADVQLNRPGLLLSNGRVYIAFGSFCDKQSNEYHGWVFGYDALTLARVGIFNTTPTGQQGAVWQAGRGLVADAPGNVYFMTGNGSDTINERGGQLDFSESFVRLDPDLHLSDWWTVKHHACYNEHDLDLGASGPLLLGPKTGDLPKEVLVGGGKDGHFYVVDAGKMGHLGPPLQEILVTEQPYFAGTYCQAGLIAEPGRPSHHIHGGPVLWDQSNTHRPLLIYNMGEDEPLKAFQVNSAGPSLQGPIAISKAITPAHSMPGAILSLSHSNSPKSGLVWAIHAERDDASDNIVPGILRVFDATPTPCIGGDCTPQVQDLRLLWHSKMDTRDDIGLFAKFTPVTIADGKAFVASFGDPKRPICMPDETTGRSAGCSHPSWLLMYGLIESPR